METKKGGGQVKLKVAVLVPDGAADLRIREIGDRTPLEVAETPNMDEVVRLGVIGAVRTIPEGMPPGSEVANMSLLGYDPRRYVTGRAPIEAASLGVNVPPDWTAFRCNLVTTDGERLLDYSAGHIDQESAEVLINLLESELGDDRTRFFTGVSYRHILVLKGSYDEVSCTPPHDIVGEPIAYHLPSGPGAERLIELMERSRLVLERAGATVGEKSSARNANMIWLWGQGKAMALESFERRFGLKGAVISAVDLVSGIGRLAGLECIRLPGMTGYLDTNYGLKGDTAVSVLREKSFVYVHVEAPDEASHIGSVEEKIGAIEKFDRMIVGRVLEYLMKEEGKSRLLVCPDHPTFISTRTHDASPVPFALCGSGVESCGLKRFSENAASNSGILIEEGHRLLPAVIGQEKWARVPGSE